MTTQDKSASSVERHRWMEDARKFCERQFKKLDREVPANTRITIGFPSTGGRGKRIGECWDPVASSDGHLEIFVSPRLSNSVELVGVLMHELVHAVVGVEAKHGAPFKELATSVGLEGKITATTVGESLKADIDAWVTKRGPYPAGALSLESRNKQTTRLLKAECETCGYVVRVTKKWVTEVGPPHCPDHGAMAVEGISEIDPTDPENFPGQSPEEVSEEDPTEVDPELPEDPDMELDDERISSREEPEDEPEDEPEEPKVEWRESYVVVQDDPEHARREAFPASDRAAAEAKARQWSKTGRDRMTECMAMRAGEKVGHKAFAGGLAMPAYGEYPLAAG